MVNRIERRGLVTKKILRRLWREDGQSAFDGDKSNFGNMSRSIIRSIITPHLTMRRSFGKSNTDRE